MYSPLWKITVFGGRLFRQIRYLLFADVLFVWNWFVFFFLKPGLPQTTTILSGQKASRAVRTAPKTILSSRPVSSRSGSGGAQKKLSLSNKHSLFSFDSSDLPLNGLEVTLLERQQRSNRLHGLPPYEGSLLYAQGRPEARERPKSARTASASEPIAIVEKPQFRSLFDFDDALSLTPDQVDMTWMLDPLDSDDDFYCYDLDVETMSVCSDSSIVAMAITSDTKLKWVELTVKYIGAVSRNPQFLFQIKQTNNDANNA